MTGGSSGLGKAIGEELAAKGYRVYGTSRHVGQQSLPFPLIELDVTRPTTITPAIEKILNIEGKIDVLINNAGVGMAFPLEEVAIPDVEKLFDTNVFGALRISQAVLPHMRKARRGMILNISSIGGTVGLPYRGIYCASKAALDMITATLRMEVLRFGIQVTSIAAGDIRTPIKEHWIARYEDEHSEYSASFRRVVNAAGAEVDKGTPPEAMAQKIEQIIRSGNLNAVYTVGKPMQRLSMVIKRILPASWFERIIMKYSKL